MTTRTPFNALPTTRRELVRALLLFGESDVEQLSSMLVLSVGAIRQHLVLMEAEGLVQHRKTGEGPGRRRHAFTLTTAADELFPTLDTELLQSLAGFLRRRNPDVLEMFFRDWHANRFERDMEDETDFSVALRQLVDRFESLHFFPSTEVTAEGTELQLHRCPLFSLTRQLPGACEIEAAAVARHADGATVSRIRHRLAGDPVCVYLLKT